MPEVKNIIKEKIEPPIADANQVVESVQPVETVATKSETVIDQVGSVNEGVKATSEQIGGVTTSSSATIPVVPEVKSELRQAVERVMEADLKDLYLAMTPAERVVFKKKGEETAKEITSLMQKTKVNLNKILKLLFSWLRVIPGLNRLYLEQEAKLKADQLLKLPK